MSSKNSEETVVLGSVTAVYGVKGWVKIFSHTDPIENIFGYKPWLMEFDGVWKPVAVEDGKPHGKGLIAKLKGIDDRDLAATYCGKEIRVDASQLPVLEEGEYYWSQLENLLVYTESGVLLGKVSHLMETGSNDVLVVKGTEQSIDRKQRLLPWLPDQVVKEIDLESGTMRVDWDPEF
ncbi:ribosome maturation factor RimM [Neptuniibacter sp. CAU 1671]|uniref:ribosome maturation factor RimM n=1 Tax=Neptuniibacter sp. CAU 1671 TaxID=3032593 RepID=UPI0023DA18A7|nr:ribosome maturation factor RimM [Neptuniibacter sp. CAU 1671]MDF2181283.1 ribosome maturation factor RimM [Neptuniibacter sp. CAU 1671]